jgi:hypothetical protein
MSFYPYRIFVFRVGTQASVKGYPTRERADVEFTAAVERTSRLAAVNRVPYRVELWGTEALISHVDVPAGKVFPQPRA